MRATVKASAQSWCGVQLTATIAALALVFTACQEAPPDVRQWKPSDHGNTSTSGAAKKGQSTGQEMPSALGLDAVILTTWQNNCITCHGKIGRGDGPQAPMYQPRDLADPSWQSSVTDAQLLASIQQGKGKMPGFALPEGTAIGLVRLVRLIGGHMPTPGASASTAGTSSAPTSAGGTTSKTATTQPASMVVPVPSAQLPSPPLPSTQRSAAPAPSASR